MKKGFFLITLILGISNIVFAQEIKNVNFVQEGEVSKLIIETDKEDVFAERFHVTEDKQIILDLKNVKVSPKLLRGIDTSEFPGSTVYISGYKKPGTANDVRFAIQLRDNVRSVLEPSGNKIVLNIENRFGVFSKGKIKTTDKAAKSDLVEDVVGLHVPKSNSIEDILQNLTLSGPKKYIGKRISINVRDIPVPDILNMIADTSGFNIIIDQAVAQLPNLTLTLTNVPWDQALDTVITLSKLVAQKNANILIVKTLAAATKEKEEEMKLADLKDNLVPLVTKVFLINYATLADMEKIVKDYITKGIGTIQLDERTNSLIVMDTVESIDRIKKIIETLDTQTPQIMIEAKIVEAIESYSKRIGLTKGISFGYDPVGQIQTPVGPGFSFSSAPNVNAPTAMGMTIGIYKRLLNLDMNLQLMESESKGRVISTPKVVTQNKKAATITSSEQTSFRVQQPATGNQPALATFQNITADLNLTVTPQVTNDGAVNMQIAINKSAFGTRPTTDAPPNITRRNITTNVLVDNGATVVIGGLYQTNTLETRSGIPYLRDLPLIGWLFSTPYAPDTQKNELIIFMTPRIMNQDEAGMVDRQAKSDVSSTEL
ncbi:type IV pilus secretin PilQ [Peredibacter sp. HCB2-198]|uniref:type IV pilus secretin PilQ n=1 Tax=Peredibacter sp. HCB2-198 TaxID=3383025 RepID=UPI0038B53714